MAHSDAWTMRPAALALVLICCACCQAFIPGADGPVTNQEGVEGGNTTLLCDTTSEDLNDELMLQVWYKDNAPVYSFDARTLTEWSSDTFNETGRVTVTRVHQPTALTVTALREDDEALYHCRVDFLLTQTRNIGVNLTVMVLPSQPFFLDEVNNKVENKIGPYHEGDTLVLSCLVIGGRPAPRISWYSGSALVDASDGPSEVPGVRENQLYLPLTRDHAAPLSCRASNTELAPPVAASLQIELYLPAQNVSIHWVEGTEGHTLQVGRRAIAQCLAQGSHPTPDLSWWLDHRHLTQHSNQSWLNATATAASYLELTPTIADNGATLSCIATNVVMAPSRGSKADVITLNVTYSPIVEVSNYGTGRINEVLELDTLHLECEIRANPPVDKIEWFYNESKITRGGPWGDNVSLASLTVEEATRDLAGRYSCAAANSVGETRAHYVNITVLYSPQCTKRPITLSQETISCHVNALPAPDTYFWHIRPHGQEVQHLTTGSPLLPLTQISGSLSGPLHVVCEASNGVATQEKSCELEMNLEHLRPPQPQQCDLAFEFEEFQMRCIPVENATHYEVSLWRMSTSNTSLILERRASMGWGSPLAQGTGSPWLLRGALGQLKAGDEAGASACNRYGCSRDLLLRPSDILLKAAAPSWWSFLFEKDVGISLGAVVLIAVFFISTFLAVQLARRTRTKSSAPVMQVLQLDDVAREYLDAMEHKRHASRSLRSCSSGYSGGSLDSEPPAVDRLRKPYLWDPGPPPPPDVTLTLHRESAV